jgi:hypothetical protein
MPLKTLRWWEQQYLDAIGYAAAYGVGMSFMGFCAARHLEEPEIGTIREFLEGHGIGTD